MTSFVKTLSTLLFLFITIYQSGAQSKDLPVDKETNLITYQEVVQEKGTKQEFFNRAIEWINDYYKNPVDVTKTRDPESGTIKGLHRFKFYNTDETGLKTDAGVIQYEFTLEFKEGRYRYTLTDFIFKQSSKIPVEKWMDKTDPQYNPVWDTYLDQVKEFAYRGFKSEGRMQAHCKKEDNWQQPSLRIKFA